MIQHRIRVLALKLSDALVMIEKLRWQRDNKNGEFAEVGGPVSLEHAEEAYHAAHVEILSHMATVHGELYPPPTRPEVSRGTRLVEPLDPLPQQPPPNWWQLHANRIGKVVLVLASQYRTSTGAVEPCSEYGVLEEDATEWESDNSLARYQPQTREES